MRRLILMMLTVTIFGFLLSTMACWLSSGGADTEPGEADSDIREGFTGMCPDGEISFWNDVERRWHCYKECPDGYVEIRAPWASQTCVKPCPDGSMPVFGAAYVWECNGSPTATPTATATATAVPTVPPTATPTATAEDNCINGTWTGTCESTMPGYGGQNLTFVISANGTSISGSVKHVSDGVTWTHSATGSIGRSDSPPPPTSFRFGNSSDTTFEGTFVDCHTIQGTYTDVHGDKGTFLIER